MVNRCFAPATDRLANVILTAAFLAAIAAPLLGHFCGLEGGGPLRENRGLAARPALGTTPRQWRKFVLGYRGYFNDNFGFRSLLVRLHAIAWVRWLDSAPNERVLLGRDGWLYLNKCDQGIQSTRAANPFTPQDLEQWRKVLERRRDWFREQGVVYVFAVAPDKTTIYPEHLPPSITRLNPKTRLEQLVEHVAGHSDVTVVDLRPALLAAKRQRPVYYQTDTHWNGWGEYLAYRELMNAVSNRFPELGPRPQSAFRLEMHPGQFSGDLAGMAGLNDYLSEDDVKLIPVNPPRFRPVPLQGIEKDAEGASTHVATECPAAGTHRLVMFHDSFGVGLQPLLSEHFGRAVYVRTLRFPRQILDREKPDVVIQEVVERSLINGPPKRPFDD